MMHMLMRLKHNEKGLTLAEVLASIVILSIILISGLSIIIQSAKTNKTSENIIDATYIAQKEMENIYEENHNDSSIFKSLAGYEKQTAIEDWDIYHVEREDYFVEVRVKESEQSPGMVRIVIQVYEDETKTISRAQMENLFKWEG